MHGRFLVVNSSNEIFSTLVLMHCFLTTNGNNRCAINFQKKHPLYLTHTHTITHSRTYVHMRLLQFFMVNFLANISQTLSLPSDSCDCDCVIFITFFSHPLSAIPSFIDSLSHSIYFSI